MIAITGASIFDGADTHKHSALVFRDGEIVGIFKADQIPANCEIQRLGGGLIAPGYVDLQVNGGGGVLFNDDPSIDGIRTICQAHSKHGTTALLPTLITDAAEVMDRAIQAGVEAEQERIPGFLGLHLEGPHLSVEKKGAHDARFIRPMDEESLEKILAAKQQLRYLMITVAPEAVSLAQISTLAAAGIVVSLGHSGTTFVEARAAAEAGATCVTHLFNAMSPLSHREPGMVGAALRAGSLHAGLIADGYHVDPAAISIALAAKNGPGRIFLVTDAMSTIGTDIESFDLNGRTIWRRNGRLELEDGTLAGADLDMNSAVAFMNNVVGTELEEALRMASTYPAACIGCADTLGTLKPGCRANLIHLDENHEVRSVWIDGAQAKVP